MGVYRFNKLRPDGPGVVQGLEGILEYHGNFFAPDMPPLFFT
jgi:hypothetical protein